MHYDYSSVHKVMKFFHNILNLNWNLIFFYRHFSAEYKQNIINIINKVIINYLIRW